MASMLQMKNISKSFGVVRALDDVSFELNAGEVHALMGENGAGKSTLMNILSGGLSYYDGNVFIDDEISELRTPVNAQKYGIAKIHQELQLVPYMSVAENIFMGREKSKLGFIDSKSTLDEARAYLAELDMFIDPKKLVKDLRVGEQQMVEIAKALSMQSRILIMDEPTSAISKAETEDLFKVINKLKDNGVGIIYITHRMDEIFVIADRITVLRDGKYIDTVDAKKASEEEIISLMVGRSISNLYPKTPSIIGDEVLRVEGLNFSPAPNSFRRKLEDISLRIRSGEVVGIAGLMGSGRSEFCECIFGAHPSSISGDIYISGEKADFKSPKVSIKSGISFATEDRKGQGLVLQRSIGENMSLPLLKELSKNFFMDKVLETELWSQTIDRLRIKAPSHSTIAGSLSGGNQQKVVLGKWLLTKPKLLILDEPTRGIDVGAKSEVYNFIDELASEGMAILVVSSEMPELIGITDRIVVFSEGRLTGEFKTSEATQENLLWAATRTEG